MEYNKRWFNTNKMLNQLEEEKDKLRDEMVQKTKLLVFQLDRQEQYIRREIFLFME